MHSQPDPDQILFIPPASHAAEEAPVTQAIILEDVFEPAAPAEASQEKGLSLFTHEVAPEAVHVQVQEEPPSLFAREIVPVTKEMTAAPAVPVREERPVPAPQLIPPTAAQERPLPPPSASQQPMFTQSGSDLDAKPVNTPAAVPSPPKFGPAARE
ncbi:MAG TPA: hypothetical protein VGV38_04710 [Pyrinomonadaceae bacterium]|nr:hypothetical protein [Pyrinomonadaceae bacterium]